MPGCCQGPPEADKKIGLVVQLVRIPACHAGGREFESRPDRDFDKFSHRAEVEKQSCVAMQKCIEWFRYPIKLGTTNEKLYLKW